LLADPATRAKAVRYAPITGELIADPNKSVRTAVAHHPDLDTTTAVALSDDQEPAVRYALIFNPSTPEPLRIRLLDRAASEDPRRFLRGYYLGNAWKDRTCTGWLWNAPLPVRLTYVDSPHYFFRRAVANTDLPPDAVQRLLRDPDPGVRRNVARRNNVAPAELVRIITEVGDDPSVLPELVDLPQFPPSAYEQFATSAEPRLRARCGRAPGLPDTLVAALARDEVDQVRCAAAAHANLPPELLAALLTDPNEDVAAAGGASPSLPIGWMETLSSSL
jgi:hypothetical protein